MLTRYSIAKYRITSEIRRAVRIAGLFGFLSLMDMKTAQSLLLLYLVSTGISENFIPEFEITRAGDDRLKGEHWTAVSVISAPA